jgi:hypothetical protein
MMIPPVVGSAPPAPGTDTPGDGFAEAIAAALGIPTVRQTPTPIPAEGGEVDVAVPAPAPYTAMPDQIAKLVAPVTADGAETAVPAVPDAEQPPVEQLTPESAPALDLELLEGERAPVEQGALPTAIEVPEAEPARTDATIMAPVVESPGPAPTDPDTDVDTPSTDEAVADVQPDAAATVAAAPTPTPVSADVGESSRPASIEAAGRPTAHVESTGAEPTAPEAGLVAGTSARVDEGDEPRELDRPVASRTEPISKPATEPTTDHRPDLQTSGVGNLDRAAGSDRTSQVPATTLHRVESAIRQLENAPPPKTITITVDDQGLHKVTVSLHADGVRLSVPDGASTDARLITDLEHTLESRGFDLGGRNDRRGRQQRPDEADRFVPTAPAQRTRGTDDSGVRI